jgi:hypothetical protein
MPLDERQERCGWFWFLLLCPWECNTSGSNGVRPLQLSSFANRAFTASRGWLAAKLELFFWGKCLSWQL